MNCDKCGGKFLCGEDVYVLKVRRSEYDEDRDRDLSGDGVEEFGTQLSEMYLCSDCIDPIIEFSGC